MFMSVDFPSRNEPITASSSPALTLRSTPERRTPRFFHAVDLLHAADLITGDDMSSPVGG